MSIIPTLVTGRLVLRPFKKDDEHALIDTITADTDVMRTLPDNDLPTAEHRRQLAVQYMAEFNDPWKQFGWGGWAVTLKDDSLGDRGKLIGFCGLLHGKLPGDHPELGYGIGKQWWGRRIVSEAAKASIDWLFRNTAANKAWAVTYDDNIASQKVLLGLGMVQDGSIDLYNSISEGRGLMPYFYINRDMHKQQLRKRHQ